jgi:hypothetical protein
MLTRCITLVLVIVAISPHLRSQERRSALSSRQVEVLVRDLPDARLAEEIRTRGIDPPLTAADFQRLRAVGAGPNTQAALMNFLVRSPLTISVNPVVRDVTVTVGDHIVATDSTGQATIDGLPPGAYVVVVEKPPVHPRIEQRIYLAEGGSTVRVSLRTATGKMTVVAANRDARIEIRDKGSFSSPLRDLELPAGTYSVVVTAPTYLPYNAEVEVLPDQTKVVQATLLPDRPAMARFVEANSENLTAELRGLLERGESDAFRTKAKVILEYSGDKLLDFKLLHHHASGFHEAKLTLKRSGLLYEPLGQCQYTAELLPWNRISRTAITRQGASGVLLLVEVAAGKNFDKKVPLNFAVLGSSIGQESETKPIKAGRVTFGESTTTRNRVQSPSRASQVLADLAWIIDQAQGMNRSGAPQASAVPVAPSPKASSANRSPSAPWNPTYGPWTRFEISNETFRVIQVLVDDVAEPIIIRAQHAYVGQLQEGSTHTVKAVVGGSTFNGQFRVPRLMNPVWVTEQGIQIR